jgi:hypothetical protein
MRRPFLSRKKPKKVPPPEEFENRSGETAPAEEASDGLQQQGLTQEGVPLGVQDSNFQAELLYEGYSEIKDYDNTVLRADIDQKGNPVHELKFKDRESIPTEDSEEKWVDPQGLRDGVNPESEFE